MNPDRCFNSEPSRRAVARALYDRVAALPLICPHGHVDPQIFVDPGYRFGTPVDLFLIPDHYIFRMLYSQGIALEALGIPRRDGQEVETDHRGIWRLFARHWYLFRGTPSSLWLTHELESVFDVTETLTEESADRIYDRILEHLHRPEYSPRALFERFRIEVLATTDPAESDLRAHRELRESGWNGRVIPTFRPDGLFALAADDWSERCSRLAAVTGLAVEDYASFVDAIRRQRLYFKANGATATDHAAEAAGIEPLSKRRAEEIFARALMGAIEPEDARLFASHMLFESAGMSVEDGLVMQLHVGSLRNHNPLVFERFGPDKGADIPLATEWTRSLKPLLDRHGNDPRLSLILFTLDESTYSRELAPIAGHYPAVKLGPPWWFFDSVAGMRRFRSRVSETAGLYNTAGFNDDTRAFLSIPSRHDIARRVDADWLAGLVVEGLMSEQDSQEVIVELAHGLAKRAYKL